jgi:uncharacterized protein YndB with AHSA1/START domain
MAEMLETSATAADRELVLTRVFRAPRELVWKAFTEAEHIAHWFGPRGFSTRVDLHDFRIGGQWKYVMVGPDGAEYPCEGVFQEIVPHERYVTTDAFGDDFQMPDATELPQGIVMTALFEDDGAATKLTLRIMHASVEDRIKHEKMGVVDGWGSSFDCLDEHLAATRGVPTDRPEVVVDRVIYAPRELVWKAFTDIEHVSNWWGPVGFTTTTQSADLRPGGAWIFTMHGPDGTDYKNKVIYTEVKEPELLAYRHAGEEEHEHIRFHTTVTFDDLGGATRIRLRSVFDTIAERDRVVREYGALEGGHQTLSRLAEHVGPEHADGPYRMVAELPSDREIRLTRLFNAPRDLLFKAMSKPEHLRHWWGCGAFTMTECEMDFRVGGTYRIVLQEPGGNRHPFTGTYKSIDPPRRIIQTFIYDVPDIRDHAALETMTLEDLGEKSLLTVTVLHDSRESRDGHFYSGMESGAAETYTRLEAYAQTLR